MTMPPTTSWVPSFTAAPWRTAWPMRTSPRSPTYTGVPPADLSTIFLMSSSDRIRPTPRMMYCSDCCDTMLPPTFELLSRIALVHRLERQVVLEQPVRIDHHLVLLQVAPEGVHLRHAGHALEQRRHHPVLQRAQAGEIVHRVPAGHSGLGFQRVLVNLAHGRRHRPHRRLHALRDLPRRLRPAARRPAAARSRCPRRRSKTSVTTEMPYFVTDRISARPGRPRIELSMG